MTHLGCKLQEITTNLMKSQMVAMKQELLPMSCGTVLYDKKKAMKIL